MFYLNPHFNTNSPTAPQEEEMISDPQPKSAQPCLLDKKDYMVVLSSGLFY